MEDRENIWEIISREIAGEATPEEDVLFEKWLNEDSNRQVFESLSNIRMANFKKNSQTESKKVFADIQHRIALRNKRIRLYALTGIAAAAALLLFVVNIFLKDAPLTPTVQALVEVTSPIGSRASVVLEDGTKAWLNAGTNLSYPKDYGENNRDVFLKGEAYFEVTKNMEIPFVVHANGVNITALGTTFNVKAYVEEENVETTLTEGSVKVEYADEWYGNESVILQPNQKAVCKIGQNIQVSDLKDVNTIQTEKESDIQSKNIVIVEPVEDSRVYTSWKDSKWVFKHEKLGNLSRKLERRYGVTIVFEEEGIKNHIVSGTFLDEDLTQALETLKLIAPIQYQIDHKTVFLKEDKKEMKKYRSVIH